MRAEYIVPIIINVAAIFNFVWSLINIRKTHKRSKKVDELLKKAEEVNNDAEKYFQMTIEVYHQEVERIRKEKEEKANERI